MADCERALGHPDRALIVTEDPQAKGLHPATRVELLIVASGARRDLGQPEAAVISLQVAALEGPVRPWTTRLRYAYADALLDAGREDEARQWFARAAEVDERGETDAEDRLLELDGMVFADLQDEGYDEQEEAAEPKEGPARGVMDLDMSTFITAARVPDDGSGTTVEVADEAGTGVAAVSGEGSQRAKDGPAPVPVDDAGTDQPVVDRSGSTGLGFVAPAQVESDGDGDLTLFD
jgi:hypothetical protein